MAVTDGARRTGRSTLAELTDHPHARAVLEPALPPGVPAQAYLFHGPSGAGKRAAARAFATALLADGPRAGRGGDGGERTDVAGRVARGTHPDLTWVRRSGASEMLVSDIDGPVVGAAGETPFEAPRRVFVIDGADHMNDQAANRLLKTLEDPAPHAHLILIAENADAVLTTVASRCQRVRFEALRPSELAAALEADGVEAAQALACARIAGGDGRLARTLASEAGRAVRAGAEEVVAAASRADMRGRPWLALLDGAREAGVREAEAARATVAEQLELLPQRERRRAEREGAEAARRAERRGRAERLELSLRLIELWLRDGWCMAEGAADAVLAVDRISQLQTLLAALGRGAAARLASGVELAGDARLRLALNVSEELALETLAYRLEACLATS